MPRGRDRGHAHGWDAQGINALAPLDDEIVIPTTSSSLFVSTNIDYVLRNLGVRYHILCGVLTDQCVESAVRDGRCATSATWATLVTLVPDACATHSQERHDNILRAIEGYCRQRATEALLAELEGGPKEDPATRAGLPGFNQER